MPTTLQTKTTSPVRYIALGVAIVAAGVVVTALAIYGTRQLPALAKKSPTNEPPEKRRLPVELVEDMPHTLIVPEGVRKGLSIPDTVVAEAPRHARPLVMPGSTALDPARVMRVRTRFNAEVTEIARVAEENRRTPSGETAFRELRPGDKVQKGEMIAVVWSVDVGGKKSDLVDALVQLRLDEQRLKAREKLFAQGSLPEDTLNQTRHDVVSDRNAKELRGANAANVEYSRAGNPGCLRRGRASIRAPGQARQGKGTALGSLRIDRATRGHHRGAKRQRGGIRGR